MLPALTIAEAVALLVWMAQDRGRDVGDRMLESAKWCASGAQQHANGVDILLGKNTLGQPAAFFCAYHEIREREGEDEEVRARVYSDDWPAKVEDWDLAARMRSDPELLANTLRALRRER